MANTKIVEKIVEAFIEQDYEKVILLLDNEIELAKNKGNNTVAKRIRNLMLKVKSEPKYSGQSASPMPISDIGSELLVERIEPRYSLKEIILDPTNQKVVDDFISEWADYEKLAAHGIFPTNKVLLYGNPGTGKTRLAHALSSALNFPLVLVRLDELISSFLGKTGKNLRDIFELARHQSIILFMDEIDTVAKHRDDIRELGELKRVVTVLLQNIDNFPSNSILIGATNYETLLDHAIWRRFNLKLKFGLPNKLERVKLFKLFLEDFKNDLDFELLANLTEDFSGSSINDICMSMKKRAIINNKTVLHDSDAIQEILIHSNPSFYRLKVDKKKLYRMAQMLKDEGYELADIAKLSGIAYTTLRDNVK